MTDYLENALANHVLRNVAYTSPSAVYVGLFTVAPGETGGGTEVSGGGYARQAVTFGAPSNGTVTNSADVTFPVATASWGTIVAFAIFDAASGGNMLIYGSLTSSKSVGSGDQFKFPAGQLQISFQ
jgi:hypothetical protein